jgi:phosphate starvation-inducible membrane PsiE
VVTLRTSSANSHSKKEKATLYTKVVFNICGFILVYKYHPIKFHFSLLFLLSVKILAVIREDLVSFAPLYFQPLPNGT